MGALNILGVKRVEALQTMLHGKYASKIAALPVFTKKTPAEITEIVDAEFGITSERKQLDHLKAVYDSARTAFNEAQASIDKVIGGKYDSTPYAKRKFALENEQDPALMALAAERDAKKNALWLCETLEDARAIVEQA
jgi:hypothetical protein